MWLLARQLCHHSGQLWGNHRHHHRHVMNGTGLLTGLVLQSENQDLQARQILCSVCETWLPENWDAHEKAESQKLKRKAASAAKKLQDAMDNSIKIQAPEEVLGPKEMKSRKSDEMTCHKSKSHKSATGDRSGGVQSKVVRPSKSDRTSRTETGMYGHHHRSRDEDRRRDCHSYSRDHGSHRHRLERCHLPRRHTSDHYCPASTSGRSSDRGREWSSTSCTATSAGSCHRDPTGRQGSSRQFRAEDRVCGSTAQPAASSLSKRETSSHGDLSGHPGSTQ